MAKNDHEAALNLAGDLAEAGDLEGSLRVVLPILDEDFDNPQALFIAGYVFVKSEKPGLAYALFERASRITPDQAALWANMGKCFHEQHNLDAAERVFREALRLKPEYDLALNNMGLVNLNRSNYGLCIEYCNRALKLNPENTDAKINRSMANLALGKWDWENYNLNVGTIKDRKELDYKGEPRWDGTPGKRVVVYGEQGIGDEINFASCIPDLQRDCEVIIDCDKRLESLFRRSFNCPTYGTRYKEKHDWAKEEAFDAHIAVGVLPQFYRKKDEDFPGTSYLKPNPVMQVQWRALLDSLGTKPKIGIAWNAGRPHTFSDRRSIPLETLAPLFDFPADWISLEYKTPEGHEKYGIHHWAWGVETYDYDQTAALVSELDLVISVTTTVHHLAGALGKECWVLTPEKSLWQQSREVFHWAKSVTLIKQKKGTWPIHLVLQKLKEKFATSSPLSTKTDTSVTEKSS